MSPKQRYRSDLFSPEKFASAHLLDSALEELKGILTKHNFKHVFQDLLDNESPRVLLLVLSSLSETTPLISWLLESFPSEPANYDATVHYNIISRISTELISSSLIKEKEPCARYHEIAQIAPKVLKSLVSFLGRIGSEHYEGKAHMSKFQQTKEDGPFAFVKKDFDILKIDIPETSSETSVSMDHVLQSQKDTLKFYLELLRRPEIYVSLKEHCIVSEEERIAPGPVVEPPSAYPIVQPMKSALYFDTTDGFGKWTVIISTNADNFLRRTHKKDLYTFNITVKKIKELSCGHFTVNNQKRLSGRATEVPIFMAKVTCNLRLIYQIDTIPGDEKREQQALKIFGIYTHAQIDNRLWSSISSQLRKKGEEYRKRCAVRMPADSQASKNIFIPAFFPPLPEVLPSEIEGIPDLRPDETVEVHSRLLFEKYVTFSQPFLNTILADVNVIFPHTVSMQETRIIEHPKSCYVIGRSGTGKTTTILFKMLLIEQTFRLMESGLPRPRQVFVTKSRMLAKKVQEDFSNLASSLAIASRPSADLMNLSRAQYQDDIGLIDIDDIVDWRTDLPAKYSELEERHFPLFITFDGLCEMLEADMGAQTSTSIERNKSHMSVITLESFFEYYWSYFPEPLVKGLDPTLVFSQIIGVIKGSKETLSEEKRHLSRATYLDLSKRQQSTFADRRGEVYKLFELYMHKKKVRGDYDTADRTHNILKYFTEQGIPGQGLDHLYVDEVQDNMLIDTMVLRALCSNADGLFWAGDTAQTISVGSAFRFNGLKAFQWEIEDQYQRKRGLGAGKTKGPPETFQLAVNYRTHAGIVNFAHSVIDLITVFWKDSIDRLSPEISSVDGTKPVFFKTEDSTQLAQFILGDVGKYIEFGAQQCIIVRNETARERFRQQVGEVGLVLTIYESKGLEFNDVLLYDFFADSLAGPAQWRVVLNAIEETNEDPKNLPPRFDSIRHASICDELKFLYVAITRARENIWIVDGSETGEPMRIFWMRKDLIQNYTLGSYTSQLASSSTSEKWASRGRELFYRKQFSDAKHCYIRANLPILASIAGAYDLRVKARKVIGTSKPKMLERNSCFSEAAISFSECATITSSSKASLMYFRISGECFEQADQKCRAAKMFFQAQEYNHSTELYRDLGKFDEAVAIVKAHGDEMSSKVVKNVIELARLTYFSNRQMKKAHELFDSPEEELEYLEERDLDIALADLLETMGRCSEAAELHYFEGRREEAIDLFLREAENKSALRRAQECILEELWHRISFGADSRAICSDLGVSRLMRFASRFDTALMGKTEAAELFMFTAIMQDDVSRLRELALEFHKVGHSSATLLCLDQYFSRAPRIQDLALVDAIEELSMFYTYVDLLSATAFRTDPCGDVATATLFGFRRIAENEFLVPQNTWLYRSVDLRPRNVIRDSDLNLRLSVPELRELFQDALRSRLKQRTATENDECARSKAFMPCLVFAVSGFCRRPKCPEAHVSPLEITPGYYNMRVRLHLQQILILQSLRENAHADVEHRGTKFWLNRLYEALYPPHHVFGSISDLALSTIPEAAKALNVMKDWVRTLVYSQVYTPQTTFLTDVMRATTLTFMFDRSQADYLRNAAYFSTRPPLVYIRRGGSPILPELLGAMSGTHTWSLAAGFAFVEHVIERQLPINVGVLCDLVDFLCSSVILCGRRPGMTVMHDVTVPRSWLLRFIKHDSLYLNPEIQTNTFHLLLTPMRDLLEQLYDGNGSEYLLYGPTRNLSNVPAVIRDVYMTRICKAIGLLGYNIRSDILRNNIRKLLLSLRREGCLLPSFYSRYVDAASDSWAELAKAIRLSLQYDTMDEMIHLVHKSQVPARDCALIGVRQVVYDNLMEIQELLDPNSSVYSQSESLIEVSTQLALDDQADEMECPLYAESVRDEEDSVDEIDDTIVAIPIQDMPRLEPSTEETAAASLIQRVYRKVLRHRRGIAKSGMAGLRAQIYASCTKEVPRLGDNPGLYLRFFLGPLPHILACLEIVRIDSLNQKQKTKKRFLDCSLDELDALDGLLMQINKASKAAVILQKQLSPSSAFHERCDGKELEQLVEEVKVLVSSLSFKTSSNLSDDLHLAIKGISTARSSTGARKEPTLKIRR